MLVAEVRPMTEIAWLACDDPDEMLLFLGDAASNRQLRLFTSACCRRIEALFPNPVSHRVVDLVERVADDSALAHDLERTAEIARDDLDRAEVRRTESGCSAAFAASSATESYPGEKPLWVARRTADCVRHAWYWDAQESRDALGDRIVTGTAAEGERAERRESAVQADLIRDVFGNPFRPVAIDLAWRTDTAVTLAQQMYESRDFSAMPILADALQDAGCSNDDILNHCRGPGPHVRGCWVCDLVLGR
jgi:hypothetical protein